MKKIIVYSFTALLSVFSYSCNDWLNVTPKSEVAVDEMFSKESGFRDALMGVYTTMNELDMYGGFETSYIDAFAGLLVNTGWAVRDYLYLDPESSLIIRSLDNMWAKHYYCIANLNELIAETEKADKSIFNPGVYELLMAEALALRGFLYTDLIRMWGPVPTRDNMSRQAVPYYTDKTVNAQPALTLEQAIEMAAEDLLRARSLFQDYDPILRDDWEYSFYLGSTASSAGGENDGFFMYRTYRMNYYAATAALARLYLHAGNLPQAGTYAKEVIRSGKFQWAEESDRSSLNQKIQKEYVFQLYKHDMETKVAERLYYMNSTTDGSNYNVQHNRSGVFIDDNALSRDWRADNLFTGNFLNKYYASNVSTLPLLKISEMHLIAAEADDSFDHLNELRSHRGYEGITYDRPQYDLVTELEIEYMREFLGEGQGYYYYKRTGKRTLKVDPTVDHTVFFDVEYPQSELEFGLVTSKRTELAGLNN